MALNGISGLLRRHRVIAIDSCVFIYQLEANARYLHLTTPLFDWLERPTHMGVTSTVSLTEILVPAYQHSQQQVDAYIQLFGTYPRLAWTPPAFEIASLAAKVRARYGLRTPDALQAATAIGMGATLFVTNDRVFRRIQDFESAILEDLL